MNNLGYGPLDKTKYQMSKAIINLVKSKLHIKYGFDKVIYQISKACAFIVSTKRIFRSFSPYESI